MTTNEILKEIIERSAYWNEAQTKGLLKNRWTNEQLRDTIIRCLNDADERLKAARRERKELKKEIDELRQTPLWKLQTPQKAAPDWRAEYLYKLKRGGKIKF